MEPNETKSQGLPKMHTNHIYYCIYMYMYVYIHIYITCHHPKYVFGQLRFCRAPVRKLHMSPALGPLIKTVPLWTKEYPHSLTLKWSSTVSHNFSDKHSRKLMWVDFPHLNQYIQAIYVYRVIDLKALVKNYDCEDRLGFASNPRESYFVNSRT